MSFAMGQSHERVLWAGDEYQQLSVVLSTLSDTAKTTFRQCIQQLGVLSLCLTRVFARLRSREDFARRRAEYEDEIN